MRLRGKFTFWFIATALVPVVAATLVTREVLVQSYESRFALERDGLEQRSESQVANIGRDVQARVEGLASESNELVGGLLLELEKAGGVLTSFERRRLAQVGGLLMKSLSLDLLFIIDERGRVLIAPHNRGLQDTIIDDARPRIEASSERPFFAEEPIISGDEISSEFVVVAGKVVGRGDFKLTVIGGQTVGSDLVANLRDGQRVFARVVNANGDELLPPLRPWRESLQTTRRFPLAGFDGTPHAFLEVGVSDADLIAILEEVTLASAVLGGIALFSTILIGFFLARRMTQDLDRLVAGAGAVARDDLDHRIEVGGKDEIAALAEAFNTMIDELKDSKSKLVRAERIAAWQEIAKSLAHEIKNPLTPIQMSVETLRRSRKAEHVKFDEIFDESTATILEETDRLKRIVSEFAQFARMPKPSKSEIDVVEIVRGATSLYRESLNLRLEIDERVPRILGDKDHLTQVVMNLLENAREAIGDGADQCEGVISVGVSWVPASRSVVLRVGDNGPGVSDDVGDRVFTPYFTTKGQRGTGLGLAVVHRIVDEHGGKVRLGRSEWGGAEFTLTLPADDEQASGGTRAHLKHAEPDNRAR